MNFSLTAYVLYVFPTCKLNNFKLDFHFTKKKGFICLKGKQVSNSRKKGLIDISAREQLLPNIEQHGLIVFSENYHLPFAFQYQLCLIGNFYFTLSLACFYCISKLSAITFIDSCNDYSDFDFRSQMNSTHSCESVYLTL